MTTDNSTLPPGEASSTSALALLGLAVCEASGRINAWSLTLLWLTFITGLLSSLKIGAFFPLLVASLGSAGFQAYFAWRLAFDRQVFAAWAGLRNEECLQAQRAFDIALGMMSKKKVPAGKIRPMCDRLTGVRRLHLLQIAAMSLQAMMLLVLMVGILWVSGHA